MKIDYMMLCLVMILGIATAATVMGTGPVVALSNYSISPAIVKPGTVGSVSVTFTNTGDALAYRLSVYYGDLEGAASMGPKNAGDLAAGTSTTIVLPFSVPEGYGAGVYSLPILVFYANSNSANFVIPVTVSKPAILQVQTDNVSKQVIKPGEEFDVLVTLNNTGGTIKDVILAAPQNSSFQLSGISKYVLASLPSGSSANINIHMISGSSISTGTYTVPVEITYTDLLGATTSEEAGIGPVRIVDLATLFTVTAEPLDEAAIGSTIRLNVTISNSLPEDEHDVFVEVASTDNLVMVGSTKVPFGTVPANGETSKTILLGINPSATVGYYLVPLTVQLSTGQSFDASVGMLVQAASQISVASETSPSIVTPGATVSLTVRISNIGDSAIRSVLVSLDSESVSIESGNNTFIGTLNVDDTGTVIATVRAPQGKTENYPIEVLTTFKDNNNQEHKVEKTIYLSTSSSGTVPPVTAGSNRTGRSGSQQGLIGLWPIAVGAIVLIIVIFFGYRWWKGKGIKGVKK